MPKDKDCYFWGNQYGRGLVLKGQLAEDVTKVCEQLQITPEELLKRVINDAYLTSNE